MTLQRLGTHFFTLALTALLYFGWINREDNYLSAENGTGYMLGILGGSLMLILLLYPLSKRIALFTRWIPIRFWFGIHMLFGIIGPLMILFHSNFHLGSTNSSIALICMLLVAASGTGLLWRQLHTTRSDLTDARGEAEQWRRETQDLIRGLGAAIQKQFTTWQLTRAEAEVGLFLLKGLSHREIAQLRETSERTIREQARSVYRKASLSGRAALSAFFLEELLLPLE